MSSEPGPLRFDELYKPPVKAPAGAAAAAILIMLMGVYSIASLIYRIEEVQISILLFSPVIASVLIYSSYTILKCRLTDYNKSLWLVIVLSAFLGLLMGIQGYSTIPSGLVILFALFRYGGYIASVCTSTMISISMASIWVQKMMEDGKIIISLEFIVWTVPMLAILALLCLNWNVYQTRMRPRQKEA